MRARGVTLPGLGDQNGLHGVDTTASIGRGMSDCRTIERLSADPMRLTCPNCNAQYEVAVDAIPADGRDVQCSNCGTTWFQEGRGRERPAAQSRPVRKVAGETVASDELADVAAEAEAPVAEDVTPDATAADVPEAEAEIAEPEAADSAPDAAASDLDDIADTPAAPAPRRPAADEETLEILRQERAYEARQRAAARRRRQVQPPDPEDLRPRPDAEALEEQARSSAAAERERMAAAASVARSRGTYEELDGVAEDTTVPRHPVREAPLTPREAARRAAAAESADVAPSQPDAPVKTVDEAENDDLNDVVAALVHDTEDDDPSDVLDVNGAGAALGSVSVSGDKLARRELLPDIEEINSSLRPDERALAAQEEDEDADLRGQSGGNSGFRIGFLAIFAIVLILIGGYLFAGPIAEAVPALAATLEGYVDWVDLRRIELDRAAEALTNSLLPADAE